MKSVFIWVLSLSLLGVRTHAELSPDVQALCDDYWNWRVEDLPQFATFVGIHDYDDRLDDISETAQMGRYNACMDFLDRANALEPSLTQDADIVNIKVLKYELETFTGGYHLKGFSMPLNYLEGLHVDMEKQFGWMLRNTTEDYDKMLSRLAQLPKQVDQTIDVMTKGMNQGINYCDISMKNMNESLGRFVVSDPTQSPYYVYFADGTFPQDFTQQQIDDLQTDAKVIIEQRVTPAYDKLRLFVVYDYKTRPDIAVTSMSNGEEYYNQLLIFHTSTTKSAQEIHDIGLSEVDRIEAEMLEIVVEMGYPDMTVNEFSNMIRDDPDNYYATSDEVFAAFEDICYNQIPPHLSDIFKDIPEAQLKLVNAPDESGPSAYYLSGSYDGTRPGVFYVNTDDPNDSAKYEMLTLSMHEGNPGHHLQASHSIENPDTPFFRRVMEDRNYGISPSRFPMYTYYMEGWGLYAETLGFDMDLYGAPLDRYGHYSEEIFRACRLVVDTGMHALGWTRDEAIDYMFQHTASSKGNIENEVDRYITWPGQALAYKMGELKFQEMRGDALEDLGESVFDIKEFHDIVLDSIGPMDVVEEEVDKWVDSMETGA